MEDFVFTKVKDINNLKKFYPIMKELRKDLSYQDFITIYEKAHSTDGYEIVSIENNDEVLALMGFRILYDYVHGKHLYIDDLISTQGQRSRGYGAKLLAFAEDQARELECKSLRLCTGIENELGKKFYERNGWNLRAVVYKKKLK